MRRCRNLRRRAVHPATGLIDRPAGLEGRQGFVPFVQPGHEEVAPIGGPTKQEIFSFIGASFRSVWALEVLCFLKQNKGRSVPHAEMVVGLRGSDLVVSQSIESLVTAGLVVVEDDGAARYGPATAELDRMVEASAALYAKSPDAVRRAIVVSANPNISAFADAFRLRKD